MSDEIAISCWIAMTDGLDWDDPADMVKWNYARAKYEERISIRVNAISVQGSDLASVTP